MFIKQLKSLAPAPQSTLNKAQVLKKITSWYTKTRSTESNLAIANSQDDGKCASQVVAEIIFFICQESVDLLSNLGADASPHQHFITLCKNRRVSQKLWFYKKSATLQRCSLSFPRGILIFCSGNLQFPFSGIACDPRAMIPTGRYTSLVRHEDWLHCQYVDV